MILECPDCTRRYRIPEAQLQGLGREVMCSACGCVWTAAAPEPKPRRNLSFGSRRPEPTSLDRARVVLQRRVRARPTPALIAGWGAWAATALAALWLALTGPVPERLISGRGAEAISVADPELDLETQAPDIVVRTRLVNDTHSPAPTPRLVFEALDRSGRPVKKWSVRPPQEQIAPGAVLPIAVALNPPAEARRVRIVRPAPEETHANALHR